MDFIHDQTWQFIINLTVSILAIIAALVTSILLYRKQQNRKEITCEVITNQLIFSPQEVMKNVIGNLEILLNGRPANDLRIMIMKIMNTGNMTIDIKDYENNKPIVFNVDKDAEIHSVQILQTTPANLLNRVISALKVTSQCVEIEPLMLNGGDEMVLKVLLVKSEGKLSVSGRISGVKDIRFMSIEKVRDHYFYQLLLRLTCALLFIMVGLVLFLAFKFFIPFVICFLAGIWFFLQSEIFKRKHFRNAYF